MFVDVLPTHYLRTVLVLLRQPEEHEQRARGGWADGDHGHEVVVLREDEVDVGDDGGAAQPVEDGADTQIHGQAEAQQDAQEPHDSDRGMNK